MVACGGSGCTAECTSRKQGEIWAEPRAHSLGEGDTAWWGVVGGLYLLGLLKDMAQGTCSQEHSLLGTDSGSLQPTAAQRADKFRTFMLLSATAPRDLQGLAELQFFEL